MCNYDNHRIAFVFLPFSLKRTKPHIKGNNIFFVHGIGEKMLNLRKSEVK